MTAPILVVEDEPRLAELLRDYLKAAGYDAELLLEGSGAVAWIRDNAPALVLLDLMLPG
jgi:two-component system response regulator BaeR